jgi:cell division protein YceG involved in septum cleavage
MKTALFIIFILLGVCIYVIFNLLKKLEKYEDQLDEYEQFIETEIKRNEALLEALRQIDQRQMFEKDDDVGSIFYKIKETIERFKTQK